MSKKKTLGVGEEQAIEVEKINASEEVVPLFSVKGVVSFTDEQIAQISGAGCEPGEVRNELGLVYVKKEESITLSEAIARAKARYGK